MDAGEQGIGRHVMQTKAAEASRLPFRLKRVSTSQQIHGALRDRIISLELAPGQNLSRNELAEYYGVSQTPVRDAMLKLEEEGLLVIHPRSKDRSFENQRGKCARNPIPAPVGGTGGGAQIVARHPPAVLAPVRKMLAGQESALASGDLEQFAQLDRMFHRAMYVAAGVPDLWDLVTSRSGHIDRLRNLNLPDPGKPSNIMHCHRLILDNIDVGNVGGTE